MATALLLWKHNWQQMYSIINMDGIADDRIERYLDELPGFISLIDEQSFRKPGKLLTFIQLIQKNAFVLLVIDCEELMLFLANFVLRKWPLTTVKEEHRLYFMMPKKINNNVHDTNI